jgi:hypothetical protein
MNPPLWLYRERPQQIKIMHPDLASVEIMLCYGGTALVELHHGGDLNAYYQKYNEIRRSIFWRMTRPLRVLVNAGR